MAKTETAAITPTSSGQSVLCETVPVTRPSSRKFHPRQSANAHVW